MVGTDTVTIFLVYTVIIALHLALNLINVSLLAAQHDLRLVAHGRRRADRRGAGRGPGRHQSAAFVFGETLNNSGFCDGAFWFVFGIGLLMAQYTITGFDASAHMSEETRGASRAAAWAWSCRSWSRSSSASSCWWR